MLPRCLLHLVIGFVRMCGCAVMRARRLPLPSRLPSARQPSGSTTQRFTERTSRPLRTVSSSTQASDAWFLSSCGSDCRHLPIGRTLRIGGIMALQEPS